MKTPQIPLAKEGYPFIFLAAFITLILALVATSWVTYIGLVLTVFVVNFFRDPERFVPAKAHTVVSPADGKVILVEKVYEDEFFKDRVYKISIFMNIFDVHVNRIPFAGKVRQISYSPGKFYSADSTKGDLHNERCGTLIENDEGVKIAFVQVAGLIARRIVNWLEIDDEVSKGTRFGLIRFGSRVDLYVPADIALAVENGTKVRAGETIIGYLSV